MSSSAIGVTRPRLFRSVLVPLAGVQAALGLTALFSPAYFYEEFPFGRSWVEALPAYNEHLVRDVGGLFLTTAVLLGAAALWLERRIVFTALVGFLAFSLPHTIFHMFNLEPYSTVDVIGNIVTLGATVVAPIYLLVVLVRSERIRRP